MKIKILIHAVKALLVGLTAAYAQEITGTELDPSESKGVQQSTHVAPSSEKGNWQSALNAKYFGLTFHPGGGNDNKEYQYPRRIDEDAYWVLQVGVELDADLWHSKLPSLGMRLTNATFKDCINVWSGHVHLGPRVRYDFESGLGLSIGLGPTVIWRENWWKRHEVSWYNGDGFYGKKKTDADYQTAFLWYGGNLEANWQWNRRWGVVYSVVPGWPQVLTSSFGLRYQWVE